MPRYSGTRKLNVDTSEVCCLLCKKICRGDRSLKSHITQMHSGDKDTSHRGRPAGTPSWNSGLSKDVDRRVADNGAAVSATLKRQINEGTFVPRKPGADFRQRLSEEQSLRNRGGRCKWFDVNGVSVQGTWEYAVALKLNELCIRWERRRTSDFLIKYQMDGKPRSYAPDFYLPDFDVYLEIKGYWWGRDKEKMELVIAQNPHKRICIITKSEFDRLLQGELVWS